MDSFRVRNSSPNAQRKLLLPVSLGFSSVSLIHILDQHIARQLSRTGRAGYSLHVSHVNSPNENKCSVEEHLRLLRDLYPRYDMDFVTFNTTEAEAFVGEDLSESAESPNIANLVSSTRSPTSQADMLEVALTRTLVRKAKTLGCEGILWGHTTTRLAGKVLSETAKGRGFSLPWIVTDGPAPFGIDFYFPMRELLSKEVETFAKVQQLPTMILEPDNSSNRVPVSSKNSTIDGLMKEYFKSVEKDYPSIVANVVRTTNKLQACENVGSTPCRLCRMPVIAEQFGLSGWGGNQESPCKDEDKSLEGLCYGCARSTA